MRLLYSILAGITSGLLLHLSYFPNFTWVVFFCFIPFLIYNFSGTNLKRNILVSSFCFISIWNLFNLQFLYAFKVSIINYYAPLVILPFVLIGYIPFIFLLLKTRFRFPLFLSSWIIIEYIYLHWELQSPFSSLGNILGAVPLFIQWYRFTGVLGGTLWILSVNILFFLFFNKRSSKFKHPLILLIIVFFIPVILSFFLYQNKDNNVHNRRVRVFSFNDSIKQGDLIDSFYAFNDKTSKGNVDYTLLPELIVELQNQEPENNQEIIKLKSLIEEHDNIQNIILGANLFAWNHQQVLAISLNSDTIQKRYKAVLVPFGERIPFYNWVKNIPQIKTYNPYPYVTPINNTGIFSNHRDSFHVSICYESFFENYLKQHLSHSAQMTCVIAREPFSYNSHYRHLSLLLCQIQAITFQKPLIRSSWCGVSCIINSRGKVLQSAYNENCILNEQITLSDDYSCFSKSKFNYVFLFSVIVYCISIVISITSWIKNIYT